MAMVGRNRIAWIGVLAAMATACDRRRAAVQESAVEVGRAANVSVPPRKEKPSSPISAGTTAKDSASNTPRTEEVTEKLIPAREVPVNNEPALILVDQGFSDIDVLYTWYRMYEDGFRVVAASPSPGMLTGIHGYSLACDTSVTSVNLKYIGSVIVPGGPSALMLAEDERVIGVVKQLVEQKKIICATGSGIRVLIKADVIRNVRVTGPYDLGDAIRGAGGIENDSGVCVDGNFVTCRDPADLPAFMRQVVQLARSSAARHATNKDR